MKNLFLTCLLFGVLTGTLSAQSDKNYQSTLKTMFEVAGTENSYKVAIMQMFDMLKSQYPDVKEDTWKDFEKEFLKTSLDELVVMLSPVYQKYMTQNDLEGIIQFYNTPLGRKYAEQTPSIMQESMQIGEKWGESVAQDFVAKMKARGY